MFLCCCCRTRSGQPDANMRAAKTAFVVTVRAAVEPKL